MGAMSDSTTREPDRTGELPTGGWVRPPAAAGRRVRGSGRGRRPNWLLVVVAVTSLAVVIGVLFLRWRAPGSSRLIAVVGLTPFFAAPLAVGVISAWFSRSTGVRVLGAVTATAFLVTTSPIDAVIGCRSETAPDALSIYTANVLFDGGRPADVATSILAQNPDVVVMQEVRADGFLGPLREDPRLDQYRHRSDEISGVDYGTIVWSRWPFVDLEIERFQVSEMVTTTIDGPTGQFTVTGLHTLAPVRAEHVETWVNQFDQLSRIDTSTPRVLAGDFNATMDHQPFRTLLKSGWTDVHEQKGCGLDATWPVGRDLPFPIMRLDHVLVTDDFEVLDVRFADPAGSDHLPVVASVRLTDP